MDLLAQRYASPFLMLDEFIRTKQLHDFTIEVLNLIAEEKIHDARWQFYLHRFIEMPFEDYVKLCEESTKEQKGISHEEIGNTINESKMMLEGFIPS